MIGSEALSFVQQTAISKILKDAVPVSLWKKELSHQQETMDYQQTALLLQRIEAELKALQWWSHQVPSVAAMASTAPFACDLMTLAQWLQFIFLPRMQALIDGGFPLPTSCSIYPMAELTWGPLTTAQQPLLDAIKALDLLLNDTNSTAGRD